MTVRVGKRDGYYQYDVMLRHPTTGERIRERKRAPGTSKESGEAVRRAARARPPRQLRPDEGRGLGACRVPYP